jgi:general secretion pathway protein A
MVAWLKQHLALAQGRTPPAEKDSEFDQTLVREVKRFQLSTGLVPDGIVGPMTIMPLNPATDTGDPVLHGGKGAF